jgi:hypothetical protein
MFIATCRPQSGSSAGAKGDSSDNISLRGSLLVYSGPIVYKHFVPTGLRTQVICFVAFDKSKTLTNQYPLTRFLFDLRVLKVV